MSNPDSIKWHFICKQKNSDSAKDIVVMSNGNLLGFNKRKKNKYRNLLGCYCKAKINLIQQMENTCNIENESEKEKIIENNDFTLNTSEHLPKEELSSNILSRNDFDDNEIFNCNNQFMSHNSSLSSINEMENRCDKKSNFETFSNLDSYSNINETYDFFPTFI